MKKLKLDATAPLSIFAKKFCSCYLRLLQEMNKKTDQLVQTLLANLFIDTRRRGGTSLSYATQDECWIRRNYDIVEIYCYYVTLMA
jgi:hypothetical protein